MKESLFKNSGSFSNSWIIMKATNTNADSPDEDASQKSKFYDCS